MKSDKSIYEACPVYETNEFVLRLVELSDAGDLVDCYSDLKSAEFFNSDNCTSDFVYKSVEEVEDCIRYWIDEYEQGSYIRFSVVDKKQRKAIGTIEMFSKKEEYGSLGIVGVLRMDLESSYENDDVLKSIIGIVEDNFYEDFEVDSIITKSVPSAAKRVTALVESGYSELEQNTVVSYPHYFVRSRNR